MSLVFIALLSLVNHTTGKSYGLLSPPLHHYLRDFEGLLPLSEGMVFDILLLPVP
jgi:hypothetical protein